ncbi:M23 family peptidase [Bacteroides sp. 214]|uniref:M23 family metallopeptidase n=1 Tax=Bacteroides sp. 214 TaxID=2302935 RepID=UPI0013CFF55D|nr:M23 family metallopeptidase [Bacteroides sp. 214]NDW12397.1 M23 family peptidase [Bacteroides sp. 214]
MIKSLYTTLFFFFLLSFQAIAQEQPSIHFVAPFDFPLYLSGNFGEIRSNHFHGGLDFKSQGVSGKPVYAMADGYISAIRVTNGSGYVLEVAYDNGYTTILRHNEAYVGDIARRVKALQYEKESWQVEIIPGKDEYRVKAGQLIGYGGNMGYSFGPHLHLDMIETDSKDYIDPLPFFKKQIIDTKAPVASGFMIFPQLGRGVVNGSDKPFAFFTGDKKRVEAWGVIGVGIKAYDYMNGVNNRYGVHTVQLQVDGEEIFTSIVDRFSSEENHMINSWTYGQYMKSFIEPGNTLRMLHAKNNNRGLITIDEERDYHFNYTLKDVYGNTSRYNFTVKGKKQVIKTVNMKKKSYFAWDKVNFLKEPGLDLIVRRGQLYDDVVLNYAVWKDTTTVAFVYQLSDEHVPLCRYADIQIGLLRRPVADMGKYYIARMSKTGKLSSVGGKYEDGFMKGRISNLGTYTVAVDTIAPEILPVGEKTWGKSGKVVYKVKEKETGIQSYRGTIDGKFAIFEWYIMNNTFVCKLDSKRWEKGKNHEVVMVATDNCGNESTVRHTFYW